MGNLTICKMKKTYDKDPMGTAMADYWRNGVAGRLRVFSPDFDEDEIPVETLFREEEEMPLLEQKALAEAKGRVLDVGAGTGCHSLALQDKGLEVTAIDLSEGAVDVMKERGVRDARLQDFWQEEGQYDTILMMMNGIGIAGTIDELPRLFARFDELLADGGQVLLDSTDIRYVFEDENGEMEVEEDAPYYGELMYQMQYKRVRGEVFPWLYVDFETLRQCAAEHGYGAELLAEGENYDYLARLTKA